MIHAAPSGPDCIICAWPVLFPLFSSRISPQALLFSFGGVFLKRIIVRWYESMPFGARISDDSLNGVLIVQSMGMQKRPGHQRTCLGSI